MTLHELDSLRADYLRLTRDALPAAATLAAARGEPWPIRFDHCFMRVALDHAFGRRWDEAIDRRRGPAYRQMTVDQLCAAIAIAESMLDGGRDRVRTLDVASLAMRGIAR